MTNSALFKRENEFRKQNGAPRRRGYVQNERFRRSDPPERQQSSHVDINSIKLVDIGSQKISTAPLEPTSPSPLSKNARTMMPQSLQLMDPSSLDAVRSQRRHGFRTHLPKRSEAPLEGHLGSNSLAYRKQATQPLSSMGCAPSGDNAGNRQSCENYEQSLGQSSLRRYSACSQRKFEVTAPGDAQSSRDKPKHTTSNRKEFQTVIPLQRQQENITLPCFETRKPTPPPMYFFQNVSDVLMSIANIKRRNKFQNCEICCSPIIFFAIGKCKDVICSTCALRMRVLNNDFSCSFCKVQLDNLLITEIPGNDNELSEETGANSVDHLVLRFLSNVDLDDTKYPLENRIPKLKLLFSSSLLRNFVHAFINFTCWHPLCTTFAYQGKFVTFTNGVHEWKQHMTSVHNLHPCNVCLENRNVFIAEQLLYERKDIRRHMLSGDKLQHTFIFPHVRCSVCKVFCLDLDSYVQHSKEVHVTCYICDKLSISSARQCIPPAFDNFKSLESHYKRFHYSCQLCGLLAFSCEAELNLHMVEVHRRKNIELTRPRHNSLVKSGTAKAGAKTFALSPYFGVEFSKGIANKRHDPSHLSYISSAREGNANSLVSNQEGRPSGNISNSSYATMSSWVEVDNSNDPRTLRRITNKQESSKFDRSTTTNIDELSSNADIPHSDVQHLDYFDLPKNIAKMEELRRIFVLLHVGNSRTCTVQPHHTCLGLSSFFNHDTNLSFRHLSTWLVKIQKVRPLNIFNLLWLKQVQHTQDGSEHSVQHEPRSWIDQWRYLFPYLSPGAELFYHLLCLSNNSATLQCETKEDIFLLLPRQWTQSLEIRDISIDCTDPPHKQPLPSTLKDQHFPETSIDASSSVKDDSRVKPENHVSQPTPTVNHASLDLPLLASSPVRIDESSSFAHVLYAACCLFEQTDTFKKTNNTTLAQPPLSSSVIQNLQDASKKELSILSGLLANSSSDQLRQSSAESILSLCATYFLLVKYNPDATSRSRDWGSRCHAVLSSLKTQEFLFLKAYIEESLRLLPITQHNEDYPKLLAVDTEYKLRLNRYDRSLGSILDSEDYFPSLCSPELITPKEPTKKHVSAATVCFYKKQPPQAPSASSNPSTTKCFNAPSSTVLKTTSQSSTNKAVKHALDLTEFPPIG